MLIGLTGKKGSGKSLAATELFQYASRIQVVSFAAPIKKMLEVLGIRGENLHGNAKEEPIPELGGVTARYMMQTLGTEWGRNLIDPNIWVYVFENKVRPILKTGSIVVCDDVRFTEEYEVIKHLGGKIVKIERPGLTSEDSHESEQIPDADWEYEVIVNDSTVHELAKRLWFIMNKP